MAIPEGTILRVVASLLFPDNVIMQNVFHMTLTSVVGDNDEAAIVTEAVEYIEDIFANLTTIVDDDVDSSVVSVYEYDPIGEDWDEVGSEPWVFPNTASGFMLPHGVAGVVIYNTLDPDVQGRKFFGGAIVGYCEEGYWTAAMITALGNASVDVVTTFTSTSELNVYQPGVWSPTQGSMLVYSGVNIVNGTPGYQRRRKPGVGI